MAWFVPAHSFFYKIVGLRKMTDSVTCLVVLSATLGLALGFLDHEFDIYIVASKQSCALT